MAEVYLGMGRTESLIMPCATIATHAPENSTAAMLENIFLRLARIETRLIEQERRAAATLPPLRPEPDPPDGPPFYTAAQPPYPPYQPPLLPYQPNNYLPLSPYTYTTSLLHHTHQPPPPPNNSVGHQPYTTFDAAAQPLFQSTSHQPRYTAGPSPTLHPLPQQPPNTPIQHQQLGFQLYPQSPARTPSCWEPPLTTTIAANQPHQYYQQLPPLSRSDCPPRQPSLAPPCELPPLSVTAPLLASDLSQQAAIPSSIKELETNMHECDERTEIQVHVDEHKAASETTKQDLEVGIEERRRSFKDELGLESDELVQKGGAELGAFIGDEVEYVIPKGLTKIVFLYVDLHVGDVASMKHRSTSLDADARLIPPRIDTLYLGICGRENKILVLALNYNIPKDPPLVSFVVDEEGRCSSSRGVFDPGGDSSSKLLFATLFVVSWFPP